MPTDKTPEQQVRILGATLTNLADRMAGGEDAELTADHLRFVIKKLKDARAQVVAGG